jgi:hypothetical protein
MPPRQKPPLDTVVKLALGVFIGSFALIWGGMFLTRPDRSIPPYSVGSQEGDMVAMHVPPWTRDDAIETLIQRFQTVAASTRDFGKMKIQPTTPGDPAGRYQRLRIVVFADDTWAEADNLRRYLAAAPQDRSWREQYERSVRGGYALEGSEARGWIGPLGAPTAPGVRLLFAGPVSSSVPPAGSAAPGPSPTSTAPAAPHR